MQHIWYCAGWGLRVTLYEKYHCELLAKCGSLELFLRHRIIMITWIFKSVSFSLMFWSLIGYSCRKGHQEIERRKDNCVLVFIPVFFLHSFFTWSAQLCNGERIVYCMPIIKSWKEDAFWSPWEHLWTIEFDLIDAGLCWKAFRSFDLWGAVRVSPGREGHDCSGVLLDNVGSFWVMLEHDQVFSIDLKEIAKILSSSVGDVWCIAWHVG